MKLELDYLIELSSWVFAKSVCVMASSSMHVSPKLSAVPIDFVLKQLKS